jgi:GntR family transcriptional regulator, transcriptional repressor for pyruvate dehydrogenase complex
MKKKLVPIDTTSLADRVEKELIDYLLENKFKVGDSLPTEMELTEMLGVSRTVIREALLRLRMMGLIESRKKKGMVVTHPDFLNVFERTIFPTLMEKEKLKDIFELRMALEIGMADLIFLRVKKEDIETLEKIVETEPTDTSSYLFDIKQEISFHGKLYDITSNDTLKRFQHILLPVFKYVHESGILNKPITQKKGVSHRDLVEIIKNGNPDAFRVAMREHLDTHFQRIF